MMKQFPPPKEHLGLYSRQLKQAWGKQLILFIVFTFFLANILPAQTRTITGSVSDENGVGMQGVSVLPKGSSFGASSSADGKFSITINDSIKALVFSYIGYAIQEVILDLQNETQRAAR